MTSTIDISKFVLYNFTTTIITVSNWYNVLPLCNGFTVTNIGNTIVMVNDQIFYPGTPGTNLGDSRSFGGNQGEVYRGVIKVAFQQPLGNNPAIELVQKTYAQSHR